VGASPTPTNRFVGAGLGITRPYKLFVGQPFNRRAIIFVTIYDYQALFVLSGQIKGRAGCMVCVDDTVSSFLEGFRKVVYLGYKRFLVK